MLNFPRVLSSEPVFTGLAIGNPTSGEATVTVTLEAFGVDGVSLGTATLELEAKALVRQLATTVFEGADIGEAPHIRVTADREVVADFELPGVAQRRETIALAGRAASSAITGTVRQGGAGVGDVTVRLSGPVGQTRTTDPEGRHILGELPPGEYVVTASRMGAELPPEELEVGLRGDPQRSRQRYA